MGEAMWCKSCSEGNEPHLVDIDGIRASVSGSEIVCWGHSYEDDWWPCQRKAAEEHATVADALEACKTLLTALVEGQIDKQSQPFGERITYVKILRAVIAKGEELPP